MAFRNTTLSAVHFQADDHQKTRKDAHLIRANQKGLDGQRFLHHRFAEHQTVIRQALVVALIVVGRILSQVHADLVRLLLVEWQIVLLQHQLFDHALQAGGHEHGLLASDRDPPEIVFRDQVLDRQFVLVLALRAQQRRFPGAVRRSQIEAGGQPPAADSCDPQNELLVPTQPAIAVEQSSKR